MFSRPALHHLAIGTVDQGEKMVLGNNEKKFSVLIVDDYSFMQLFHRLMVESLDLEAHVAENGKEAVDLHRSGASFDLILMAMLMPVMDGVQATKELRAMGVDTMIVGVTANDRPEDQRAFLEAGLNDLYTMPFTILNLAPLVQAIKDTNNKSI